MLGELWVILIMLWLVLIENLCCVVVCVIVDGSYCEFVC